MRRESDADTEREGFIVKVDCSGAASGLWVIFRVDTGAANRERKLSEMLMHAVKVNKDVYQGHTEAAMTTFQAVRLAL